MKMDMVLAHTRTAILPPKQPEHQGLPVDWLYVRIYCQREQADELLVQLIAPCLQSLQTQGLIQHFFFIRYFENGFHLRVRCSGDKDTLLGPVRDELNTRISAYFSEHATTASIPLNWGPEGVGDRAWQRDNLEGDRPVPSFEYDRYEPETERYGGSAGMQVSEKHFMQSSEVVLRVLEYEQRTGKNVRRNITLLLLQGLAQAFQLNEHECLNLFKRQAQHWLFSPWLTPAMRDILEPAYQSQHQALQRLLAPRPQRGSEEKDSFWSVLSMQWQAMNTGTYSALTTLFKQGQLDEPPTEILFSYLHMLCNRLGFFPREEAYLVYLLYRYYETHLELQGTDDC